MACRDLASTRLIAGTSIWTISDTSPTTPSRTVTYLGHLLSTQQSVKGVKINCIGDQKTSNKPNFEAVEIPSTDPIFSTHRLPIFTRRCLPDLKWANHQDNKIFEHQSPFNNQDAAWRVCTGRANGNECCSTYYLPAYLCHLLL